MKKRLSATLTSPRWEDWQFAFHATCCLPLIIFLPSCPSRLSLIVFYWEKRIDLACKSLLGRWLPTVSSLLCRDCQPTKALLSQEASASRIHPSDQPTMAALAHTGFEVRRAAECPLYAGVYPVSGSEPAVSKCRHTSKAMCSIPGSDWSLLPTDKPAVSSL